MDFGNLVLDWTTCFNLKNQQFENNTELKLLTTLTGLVPHSKNSNALMTYIPQKSYLNCNLCKFIEKTKHLDQIRPNNCKCILSEIRNYYASDDIYLFINFN